MGIISDRLFAIADEMEKRRLAFEKRCQEREKNIEELLNILANKKNVSREESIDLECSHKEYIKIVGNVLNDAMNDVKL